MNHEDPTAICNILRRLGWANDEQIADALNVKGTRRIGETLLELGVITLSQLDEVLTWQSSVRHSPDGLIDHNTRMQDKVSKGFAEITELGRIVTNKFAPIRRQK